MEIPIEMVLYGPLADALVEMAVEQETDVDRLAARLLLQAIERERYPLMVLNPDGEVRRADALSPQQTAEWNGLR